MNNQIRFIVFHKHRNDGSMLITDLDATIDHAENLVKDPKLLSILMDLTSRLKRDGYDFKLWKEGEDQ